MSLVLAHVTTNPADAVVLVSELEAGGFHPIIFDFHHSFIAIGYAQALGGIRIMLPEDEIEDAKAFVHSASPTQDFDPLPDRRVKDVLYGTILSINPLFPLYLLPPILLLGLAALWIIVRSIFFSQPFLLAILESAVLLYIVGMLAHAKYIAASKMKDKL